MESTDQSWTYRPWQDWRKSSQYRADSVSSTHSSVSSHRGQPAASGKNKQKQNRRRGQPKASQGRSKGKKGNGKGDGGKAPPVPPPPETPSWPTLDNASFPALAALPASTSTTAPNVNLQLAAENRMLVQLLRDAYPVAQDRPPDAKAAIDKSEQELNKHVTKSIHSATKSLDKAQRLLTETTEARRRHRSSWIAHLTESIKTWETQLEAFRKHSAALQDLAQKARSDIAAARQDIQRLSSQDVNQATAAPVTPLPTDDASAEDPADIEEDRLRTQLQGILQSCASSLGVVVAAPPEVQSIPSEEEQDQERAGSKRARSAEPGSGLPAS